MLSLVTAAEVQYRHDVWSRDRDQAVLASMRDRRDDAHDEAAAFAAAPRARTTTPARQPAHRVGWARPIGAHAARDSAPPACAIA